MAGKKQDELTLKQSECIIVKGNYSTSTQPNSVGCKTFPSQISLKFLPHHIRLISLRQKAYFDSLRRVSEIKLCCARIQPIQLFLNGQKLGPLRVTSAQNGVIKLKMLSIVHANNCYQSGSHFETGKVGETVMNSFTNGFKKASKFFRNLLSSGDETEQFPNIAFYSDEIPCYPLGDTIEKVLETWIGNYSLLQTNYLYTQWLFPNRKPGINSRASVLKDTEVEVISNTPVLRERVKRAFQMMLDFYGMRLMRDDQFELTENSEERLKELNEGYNHNYLRITRILLALKELGHKELMLPWLNFMAGLIYREKVLNNAASSFENYWVDTLDTEDALVLKEHLELLKSNKPTETEAATLTTSNTEPDVLLSSTKLTSRNMV